MLLERDAQLAVVRAALLEASVGSSALILLSGQLGIGRSALLQELPACASGELYVLRANAAPMEQDFAFGVVRQLFDSLLTLAGEATRERWLRGAGRARVVFADDVLPAPTCCRAAMTCCRAAAPSRHCPAASRRWPARRSCTICVSCWPR